MAGEIAPGSWMQHRDDIVPKLKEHGAQFLLNQKLVAVNKGSVELQNVKTSAKQTVSCDITVLALGSRPDNALIKELGKSGIKLTAIGDCNKVGKIANATKAAYEAVIAL